MCVCVWLRAADKLITLIISSKEKQDKSSQSYVILIGQIVIWLLIWLFLVKLQLGYSNHYPTQIIIIFVSRK